MSRTKALLLLLPLLGILLGCPAKNVYQGVTPGTYAQDGQTLPITEGLCTESASIVKKTDVILALLAAEFVKVGHTKTATEFYSKLPRKRYGCLLEEPEHCRWGNYIVGPCKDGKPPCARKRGCATTWLFWVSRMWPPVCTAAWPEEPHCVSSKTDSTRQSNYESDLVHEICEMVAMNYFAGDQTHASDFYTKICATVTAAYLTQIGQR